MTNIAIRSSINLSAVEEYLTKEVDPNILHWDKEAFFPRHIIEGLHDLGMIDACVPEEFGGRGLKTVDLLAIADCISYHSAGLGAGWLGYVLFHGAIALYARKDVARQIIARQRSERTVVALCGTEKEAGTDILQLRTFARPVKGGYLLTGKKHFITNVSYASQLVVFGRIQEADGSFAKGLSAFYLPADAKGVRVGAALDKMGQRESNTGQVEFEEVFVPAEHLLGREGEGLDILMASLSRTKTLISGQAFGICRRAEKEALDYLERTVRVGEPLLAKREIQILLSKHRARLEAAWLLGCRAGAVWDEQKTAIYESSLAKYYSADAAVDFVQEALELVGASGYMHDHIISKLYRDVKALEIYEGASFVQQHLMGRALYSKRLKRPQASGLEQAKKAA